MGQILTVVSGKGGTGKTTLCAALASCLCTAGNRVLCIDADIGLRNLDISLGMAEIPALTFSSVMRGEYALEESAAHPQMSDLLLLTAPVTEKAEDLDPDQFGRLLKQAKEKFGWILIDAPAGVGAGFALAVRHADWAIVVSGADPASIRDAARTADLLLGQNPRVQARLVMNRVQPKMLSRMKQTVDDVMDTVGLQLLGIVPEDVQVPLLAAQQKLLISDESSAAAQACRNIAMRLCGKRVPLMRL